jgi:spore coat polysaccharide biosynthesis protein SpsF (cytidylyltransferase family)
MIVAIVQARVGSTRLPGKVLKEVAGKPMLWHLINRLKRAKNLDRIVVATSQKKEDKKIIELAEELKVESFAGSEEDVLDRYYKAATKFGADTIVRITADCPLLDSQLIDEMIEYFEKEKDIDYLSNVHPPTYPDGLDVEIFTYKALEKAWKSAKLRADREHVTPYITNNRDIFKIKNFRNKIDLSHMRWTVDEPEDYEFVKEVYRHLYKEGEFFDTHDILDLLNRHPNLLKINQHIKRGGGYERSLKKELEGK